MRTLTPGKAWKSASWAGKLCRRTVALLLYSPTNAPVQKHAGRGVKAWRICRFCMEIVYLSFRADFGSADPCNIIFLLAWLWAVAACSPCTRTVALFLQISPSDRS
uniref:Uncharacterized protein n=1 Tax=Tetraselmis sp. GSL018 TaxID=582737 RepID=A0A061QSL7_9CHLO